MKCKACLREMPDEPCAVVFITEFKSENRESVFAATIKLRGVLLVCFDNYKTDRAVSAQCCEWAEQNRLSLHFHRITDILEESK